ncbi:hypothetical protein AADZ90_019585 [Aestuariibius sp. 2305UL40-4]|uniref:hypothetical protein n=1 Tax=Aestuariibius violaceus TaxID=3234132 RepID=UPI00345E5CC3
MGVANGEQTLEGQQMDFRKVWQLLCLFGFFILGTAACTQTEQGVAPMIEDEIRELSALKGSDYTTRRDAFLASAPQLPEYPYELADQDPRYRAQYLILRGWQQSPDVYREVQERIESTDAEFMGRSAAGFFPLWNGSRGLSASKWRYDGLAFAWEDILKFSETKPRWQISNSLFIIEGFPHEDSIDPLLIAMHLENDRSAYARRLTVLSKMPKPALEDRLEIDRNFYTHVRPILNEALGRN